MNKKAFLILIYAILVLVGGIMGYTKANSFASLFMGVGFSLLLLFSAIGTFKESLMAYFSGLILSAILSFFFLWRFMQTQNFMPGGLMAVISIATLIALIALPSKR